METACAVLCTALQSAMRLTCMPTVTAHLSIITCARRLIQCTFSPLPFAAGAAKLPVWSNGTCLLEYMPAVVEALQAQARRVKGERFGARLLQAHTHRVQGSAQPSQRGIATGW